MKSNSTEKSSSNKDNKPNIPKLRFKEFDGNLNSVWKKYQIKDACDILTGFPFKGDNYAETGKFRVLRGDNVKSGYIKWDEKTKCWNDLSEKLKTYLLKNNDLIIGMDGSKVGRNRAIVSDKDLPLLLAQRVACLRSKKCFHQNFIKQVIYANKFTKYVDSVKTGTSIYHISKKQIADFKFTAPSYEEQKKIADYLEIIDKKIGFLEDKHEYYKDFKKYLLQNIFAQKLRFEGFEDKWNSVKLEKISDICTGKKDLKDSVDGGKYPFFVRSAKIERINSYSFDGEAILIPGDGKIGEVYHYINGKFDYHQRVYKISDFKEKIMGKYVYYYLQKNFLKHALRNTAKATVDSLRLPIVKTMVIEFPSIDEQRKLVSLLDNTDNKISLLEHQISKMENFKKGLLQSLFI